jgi:hypothetical protein
MKATARPCWLCGASIQYLPTQNAPRGAWVDAGTQIHHRCHQKQNWQLRRELKRVRKNPWAQPTFNLKPKGETQW